MRTNRIRFFPWLTALALVFLAFEGTAWAAGPKKALVDLNTASQKDLEELPGVGEATAKKIIAGRPYSSVSDLSKAGLSEKTISKFSKMVTVGGGSAAAPAAAPAGKAAQSAASEKPGKMEKAAPSSMAAAASGAKVDLNTASQKELEDLPGVGPATAKKIIAGRPYSSAADLSRAGVSASTIGKIGPLVTASAASSMAKGSSMAPATGKPAAASEPPPAAPPAASSARQTAKTAAEPAAAAQQPPVKGMVWVNTETKVFHREGDHWYGNTKHGKFMTEADAIKAGYRESKQKVAGQ